MAHIQLQEDLPGIRGLMVFRPETAEPLNQLADILLRGPNTLSPGERELNRGVRIVAQRLLFLPERSWSRSPCWRARAPGCV